MGVQGPLVNSKLHGKFLIIKERPEVKLNEWYKGKDVFLVEEFTLMSINCSDRTKCTADLAGPEGCSTRCSTGSLRVMADTPQTVQSSLFCGPRL